MFVEHSKYISQSHLINWFASFNTHCDKVFLLLNVIIKCFSCLSGTLWKLSGNRTSSNWSIKGIYCTKAKMLADCNPSWVQTIGRLTMYLNTQNVSCCYYITDVFTNERKYDRFYYTWSCASTLKVQTITSILTAYVTSEQFHPLTENLHMEDIAWKCVCFFQGWVRKKKHTTNFKKVFW